MSDPHDGLTPDPAWLQVRADAERTNGSADHEENGAGRRPPLLAMETTPGPEPHKPPEIVLLDGPAIAAPLPPLEHLVREIGLVAGGGAPHLVAGYGFTGKTLAIQSAALSLAAGRPIWGAYPSSARRVVHVDREQGERLTRRRYQRLALASGVDLAKLKDALVVAIFPELQLTPEHVDGWRSIMAGRDLLIVDSLRATSAGQEENDSAIRAGLDMLGSLSEATGCRALVIHHARKQGKDDPGGRYAIRGSSAIFDAADSAYLFTAEKGGDPVHVEHVKARSHGELVEAFALVVSDTEAGADPRAGLRVQVHGAELVTQRREQREAQARAVSAARDAEKLRELLATRPGLGRDALSSALGISGKRVSAALVHLGDAIDVRDEKSGRATRRAHYLRSAP